MPARSPAGARRAQAEEEFLYHGWGEQGLLQRALVQGVCQTVGRAEQLAVVAALLAGRPEHVAGDNAALVEAFQALTRLDPPLKRQQERPT